MDEQPFRMTVEGMTCDACNLHVARALEDAGARNAKASWRAGEATFTASAEVAHEALQSAVRRAGYGPRAIERIGTPVLGPPRSASDVDYDLVILGSGSAAFAAAIRARDQGARVAMIESGTIGGTCVNVGCVPSKALLRAAELHDPSGHHAFAGISMPTEPPDLAAIVSQKDELVAALRREKYEDLVDVSVGTSSAAELRSPGRTR